MSWPSASKRVRTWGSASASRIAAVSFAATSFGVPFGAHIPCHTDVESGQACFVDGRDVRHRLHALLLGHGKHLDLARLDLRDRVGGLIEHDVDLARDEILQGGTTAAI